MPDRFVKIPNGLILLDSDRRHVGQWISDSVMVQGGFGSGAAGLFDPVDLVSHQLDVFILDGTASRISRFDRQLNFIHSIPLRDQENPVFPTHLSLDSRGWVYTYSPETHELYRTQPNFNQLSPFIDLNTQISAEYCVADMAFGRDDALALLFDCANEVFLFNRAGKLERRYTVDISIPQFLIPFRQTWLILNENGVAQFLGEDPFYLPMKADVIRDIISDDGFLNILTEKELVIFDIHGRP